MAVVEVFKTDVRTKEESLPILAALQALLPTAQINFDLDDCDKILRIEDESISISPILECLQKLKICATVLE